ncbi:hypothetical protein [Halolamina salina]
MNQIDDRLAKVEKITISFETFKKALKRNFLDEPDRWGRSYVLRLYPPFEAEMEAEYYESEQGVHYNDEWNEKPIHISPETIMLEETDFFSTYGGVEWPTEANTRSEFSEEEIEEGGGIEKFVEEGRRIFWEELKHSLPEEFDIGRVSHYAPHTVELEWEDVE